MSDRYNGPTDSEERLSRRAFGASTVAGAFGIGLGGLPGAGAASPIGKDEDLGAIPKRALGKTGAEVSILGLGTAPMGEGPQKTPELVSVFSEAIDRGVTYVDTARIYGNAEDALGKVLKTRRDKVFLATKCMENTREGATKSFEKSMAKLDVEHVDLLHLHSTGDRDLDVVLEEGGLWDYYLEQKKAGRVRFLGLSGHSRPERFLRMLATDQVDVVMACMNFVDRHTYGFEQKVLPVARKKRVGVMGMKTFGGIRGGFRYSRQKRPAQMDAVFLQNAVRYSLGLEGVTGVVIGVHNSEELRQNIRFVQAVTPLSEKEKTSLEDYGKKLAATWGPRFGPVK